MESEILWSESVGKIDGEFPLIWKIIYDIAQIEGGIPLIVTKNINIANFSQNKRKTSPYLRHNQCHL